MCLENYDWNFDISPSRMFSDVRSVEQAGSALGTPKPLNFARKKLIKIFL
jgi:hypothetical protein